MSRTAHKTAHFAEFRSRHGIGPGFRVRPALLIVAVPDGLTQTSYTRQAVLLISGENRWRL
jgi:hypothetical protein